MENRFGIKDFFLFVLLAALIIVILLAMKQYDRQYQLVRDLQQQGRDQLRELVAIDTAIERGGLTAGANAQPTSHEPDGFDALRKLRADGGYTQGDWLVENLAAPVAKLTPLLSSDVYASIIQARVVESLAYRDPTTLDYMPQLATSWTIDDRSAAWHAYVDPRLSIPLTDDEILKEPDCPPADKADDRAAYIASRKKEGRRPEDIGSDPACPPATVITFKLRHGVTFSDGSPFTAADVVFSYDWVMNPAVEAPRDRQSMQRIKSVVQNGDDEVSFNFREPYFDSLGLASSISILSKSFYGKYTPQQFNDSVGLLIGTGPYKLSSPTDWIPTTGTIELIRNERYWGLQSSFDRLVYHQVPQEATELVMFTNGELDMFSATPEQYGMLLKQPDVQQRANHYEYLSPIAGYHYIAWNQEKDGKPTIFADKRVRQAMTMLTDREGICKNILLGYAVPAAGPFSPLSKQSDPDLKDWTYDPNAATALLKDAGFADRTGNGVLSLPDGRALSFKLSYPSKSATVEREVRFIKDTYASAGVAMELDPVDWTIIEQRLKTRNYDAIMLGWSAGIEDDIYQMFDSSQIADEGDDFMHYKNPELDQAIEAARTTVDESRRIPLWRQCQRILHEDQPYTFLSISKALRFIDKRIANVQVSKTGLNYVQDWNQPIPWYVPKELQKYSR
jgi:peptide/nickel transport system substrate-binding protein